MRAVRQEAVAPEAATGCFVGGPSPPLTTYHDAEISARKMTAAMIMMIGDEEEASEDTYESQNLRKGIKKNGRKESKQANKQESNAKRNSRRKNGTAKDM